MDIETMNQREIMVMKLLHYFITEENYSPILLQGAENEIWLENLNSDYKIVRVVSNHIHNDEQLDFDLFKTKKITSKIKRKTLSLSMNVLSIYLDLGDNVNLDRINERKIDCVNLIEENDLDKYPVIKKYFPDINNKLCFSEEGMQLFIKITDDINMKNKKQAIEAEYVFKRRVPVITYILIALNILIFFGSIAFNKYNSIFSSFCVYGPSIRIGEYYRLITGGFIHGDIIHLLFNCYALYVIGSQIEMYVGRWKYLVIYFFSMLTGSLLSIVFNVYPSIGASGAIFGLMGALLYFGYHYRVYLGNTLKNQIIPLIVLNLLLGSLSEGIDNYAHIGGLIGGFLITTAVGVKFKSKTSDIINGCILSFIYVSFLIYMGIYYIK